MEGEVNFFDLHWKHVSMDPHMEKYYRQQAIEETRAMDMADYEVLCKLLHMAEGVISPLSTILLEGALLGKPVLMFFPRKDLFHKTGAGIRISYKMVHFTDFWGVEGINVCMDGSEFHPACRLLLQQAGDHSIAEKLRTHAARFVVMNGSSYGERFLNLANEMTGGDKTAPRSWRVSLL